MYKQETQKEVYRQKQRYLKKKIMEIIYKDRYSDNYSDTITEQQALIEDTYAKEFIIDGVLKKREEYYKFILKFIHYHI